MTFAAHTDCGASHHDTCVDTVVAGPALAEGGGGIMYRLGDKVMLVLSSNVETAVPKFTINLDINGGVAFNF